MGARRYNAHNPSLYIMTLEISLTLCESFLPFSLLFLVLFLYSLYRVILLFTSMADLEIKSTSYPDTPAPTLSVNGPSSYFASKEVETRVPSYIQSRRDAARDLWRRLR